MSALALRPIRVFVAALVAAATAWLAPPALPQADPCGNADRLVTDFGVRKTYNRTLKPGAVPTPLSERDRNGAPARYVRALVELSPALRGTHFALTFRDASGRPLQVLGPDHFATRAAVWTRRLANLKPIDVELWAPSAPPGAAATLAQIVVMSASAERPYYGTQDSTGNYVPLAAAPGYLRPHGDLVGMVMASEGAAAWVCSGAFVAHDLFLTNWHCGSARASAALPEAHAWPTDLCDAALIDASWDGDDVDREFQCDSVVAKSKPLDYALLAVKPVDRVDRPRPAVIAATPLGGPADLFMLHHPEGLDKRVSSVNCRAVDAAVAGWTGGGGSEFTHVCDTRGGSSGAPVFDRKTERVVGLHHLGFAPRPDGTCDKRNKAVHIGPILDDIKARAPAAHARLTISN